MRSLHTDRSLVNQKPAISYKEVTEMTLFDCSVRAAAVEAHALSSPIQDDAPYSLTCMDELRSLFTTSISGRMTGFSLSNRHCMATSAPARQADTLQAHAGAQGERYVIFLYMSVHTHKHALTSTWHVHMVCTVHEHTLVGSCQQTPTSPHHKEMSCFK